MNGFVWLLLSIGVALALTDFPALGAPATELHCPSATPRYSGFPKTPISGFLRSYPEGGGPLSSAVERALLSDPSAAQEIVGIGKLCNPEQATAIASGILQALCELDRSCPLAAKHVRAALLAADPRLNSALAALSRKLATQGLCGGRLIFLPGGGFSSGGGGGGIVMPPPQPVSPN